MLHSSMRRYVCFINLARPRTLSPRQHDSSECHQYHADLCWQATRWIYRITDADTACCFCFSMSGNLGDKIHPCTNTNFGKSWPKFCQRNEWRSFRNTMIELSCINALKLLNMVHGSIQSPDRLLAIRPIWPSQSLNGALEFFNIFIHVHFIRRTKQGSFSTMSFTIWNYRSYSVNLKSGCLSSPQYNF